MACDNCDCLDCRIERGEISCDDLWNQAGDEDRARQTFGDFRCWVSESGAMMFQYRTGYGDYEPVQGEECCWEGTGDIFRHSRVLRVAAERAGWREPSDFQRIQDEYTQQSRANSDYYSQAVERLRAQYEERYEQWREEDQALRDELNATRAQLEALQGAQQPEMVLARMDSPSEG